MKNKKFRIFIFKRSNKVLIKIFLFKYKYLIKFNYKILTQNLLRNILTN